MQRVGSRLQVMRGSAKMTGGGLRKKDLTINRQGKIVSKKLSKIAKNRYQLQMGGASPSPSNIQKWKNEAIAKQKEIEKRAITRKCIIEFYQELHIIYEETYNMFNFIFNNDFLNEPISRSILIDILNKEYKEKLDYFLEIIHNPSTNTSIFTEFIKNFLDILMKSYSNKLQDKINGATLNTAKDNLYSRIFSNLNKISHIVVKLYLKHPLDQNEIDTLTAYLNNPSGFKSNPSRY